MKIKTLIREGMEIVCESDCDERGMHHRCYDGGHIGCKRNKDYLIIGHQNLEPMREE